MSLILKANGPPLGNILERLREFYRKSIQGIRGEGEGGGSIFFKYQHPKGFLKLIWGRKRFILITTFECIGSKKLMRQHIDAVYMYTLWSPYFVYKVFEESSAV